MRRFLLKIFLPVLGVVMALGLIWIQGAQAFENDSGLNQQPTVAIPTVTGTPTGPYIIVVADPEARHYLPRSPSKLSEKLSVRLYNPEL